MGIRTLWVAFVFAFMTSGVLFAQHGTSSSSMGVARAGSNGIRVGGGRFVMPPAEMFRIEEIVNYHKHQIPCPTLSDGKRVKLSVESMLDQSGMNVLQVGLATPQAVDPEVMPPLDVVLIIDRSGSMEGAKMADVKRAIGSMVARFRKNDRVSIVSFSNDATLDLGACQKTKMKEIKSAVEAIQAGGGTNLHAGLMLGFEQALKNCDKARAGRIIFLTDGNANVGVTESSEIARQSQRCLEDGISLVTIGLGVDFNHGLLREISDSGRGVMHYVGDSKDIQKAFVEEFDSLLAPAAREVKLTIELNESSDLNFFGYDEKERSKGRFVFDLEDMGHGATQVVLASRKSGEEKSDDKKTRFKPGCRGEFNGRVTLEYVDAITREFVKTVVLIDEFDQRESASVERNYAIALLAQSLKSASKLSASGNNKKAIRRLEKASRKAKDLVEKSKLESIQVRDPNVDRVLEISERYVRLMKQDLNRR